MSLNPMSAKSATINDILIEKGVPTEMISIMPEEQKADIISKDLIFGSYKKVNYDDMEKNISNNSDLIINGTIPSADMDFYISTYYYSYSSSDVRVRVYINYDWNKIPSFTLTDPYGLAWDDSIYLAEPDSTDTYTYWKLEDGTVESEFDNVLAYSASNGAGWNTDIKYAYGLKYVTDNYGFAAITLESKNPKVTGTTQLHANYTHVYGVGSIGLSFKGINVSYSGSASSDSRGTSLNIKY
jgi:hypothetical protein